MIYKLILNRMPDENSNPVGTAQTPQNDQASTSESGNDFILDFGEGEDVSETQEVGESSLNPLEINNEEIEINKSKEESDNLQDDMSQNDLFGESSENAEQSIDSNTTDLNDDFSLQFENDFSNEEESKEENLDKDIQLENNNTSVENVEEKGINLIDEPKSDETNIESQGEISDTNDLFQETNSGAIEDNEQTSQDIQLDIQEEKVENDSGFQIDLNNDNVLEENDENMEDNNVFEGGKNSENSDVEESKEGEIYDFGDEPEKTNQNENIESIEVTENTNVKFNSDNDYFIENNDTNQEISAENVDENIETNSLNVDSQSEQANDTLEIEGIEDNGNSNEDNFFNEVETESAEDKGTDNESHINQNPFAEDIQDNEELGNDNTDQPDNDVKDESQNQNYFTEDLKGDASIGEDSMENTNNLEEINNSEINGTEKLNDDELIGNKLTDENFESEEVTSKNDDTNGNSEITQNKIVNEENQNMLQPDMKNLLGGEDVSFSFDVNEKLNDKAENLQDTSQSVDDNAQTSLNSDSSENNSQVDSLSDNEGLEERVDMNIVSNDVNNDTESSQSNTEIKDEELTSVVMNQGAETGNIAKENSSESRAGLMNNIENGGENKTAENEVKDLSQELPKNIESSNSTVESEIGIVKSTLSLDQLLDSELDSNPQFSDNSKSVPNNVQVKSGIFSGKKVAVLTGILIFLLGGFVISLAFPSFSLEKIVEMVSPIGSEEPESPIGSEEPENPIGSEEPENPIGSEEPESPIGSEELESPIGSEEPESPIGSEIQTRTHGAGTKVETIDENPDDNNPDDKNSEDPTSTGIEPYPTIIEEPENPVVKTETLSINDIQSTISSFKSQGETYKNVGEEELNEKVIKYASNIIRLCEEYQAQLDLGEGLDEENFSLFKTKVSGFLSKITENLEGPDEVIVYTNIDYNEDDEKKELRNYLADR